MKRILVAILIGLVVFSLCGCGSGNTSISEAPPPTNMPIPATPSPSTEVQQPTNTPATPSTAPATSPPQSEPPLPVYSDDDGAVNEYGNTCRNLQSYGYVTQQGKATYIQLDSTIYRQYEDGERKALLNQKSNHLNVIGNMLYYSGYNTGIFSYDIASGTETELSDSNTSFMIATEEFIYYVNQDDNIKIYRLKTDGSEDKKFIDISCNSFGLMDGFIYLSDKDKTIRVSLNTRDKKTIAEDASFSSILTAASLY